MDKEKKPVELDEDEEEKSEKQPLTWKKPEPPPNFKYDDSGFPLNDKKPADKK